MVIRAADENFLPRFAMGRLQIVPLREFFDLLRGQRREELLRKLAQERVAQTVDGLEMFEEQNQPFEMRCVELAVDAVKRVRDRVRDLAALQISLQRKNIVPDDDDVVVLLFGDTPDQDVNLAGILWKISRDLLADESVGEVADFQTAFDRVVIGNGDKIHSVLQQLSMQLARVGIGIRKIKPPEKPFLRPRAEA